MSEMSRLASDLTDLELIAEVRSGDLDAYGVLYSRHHQAAERLARQLAPRPDADDLVAEGFARVLSALQTGSGPDEFFRAYLLTSIRRLHVDRMRLAQRVRSTDDEEELDRAVDFVDPAEMRFEQGTAAAAFASLPERWQLVLWHLDVEGQKPAAVAPLLGMSPNSVSALAYRAREGLRLAYLDAHLSPPVDTTCRWTTSRLSQHVRDGLSARESAKVEEHLEACARCKGLYLELAEVNRDLAGLLAPALLGAAGAGYVASSGTVAATGLFAQVGNAVGRPFRSVGASGPAGVAVATVAALAVAAVGAFAAVQVLGDDEPSPPSQAAAPPAATADPDASPNPNPDPDPDPTDEDLVPQPAPTRPTLVPLAPLVPPLVPTPTALPTDPAPTRSPPVSTPRPEPTTSPRPEPTTTPTPTPTTPTPTPTTPTPTPTTPTTTPAPTPTETDYGVVVGYINERNDLDPPSPAPRQVRVLVSADPDGHVPRGNIISVTMTFDADPSQTRRTVPYQGRLTPDWDCGSLTEGADLSVMTVTCTREQHGADIPALTFSIDGYRPRVIAHVSASDNIDKNAENDIDDKHRADFWRNPATS